MLKSLERGQVTPILRLPHLSSPSNICIISIISNIRNISMIIYQNVAHLTRKGPSHSCTRTPTPKAHPAMRGFRAAGCCWEFSGCSTNTILSVALRPSLHTCTLAYRQKHKHNINRNAVAKNSRAAPRHCDEVCLWHYDHPALLHHCIYWHKHINLTQIQMYLLGFLMLLCVLL